MASMHIREATALHKEALDLRTYLTLQELSVDSTAYSSDEPRSPSPTGSPRSGVVLFDPTDLRVDTSFDEDLPDHGNNARRRLFQLQLDGEHTDDEEEDDNQHETEEDEARAAERMRLHVMDEICATETSYVASIRTLHDHYIVPLEDNKHPIMEDAQIAVFFNNVRQIVMLNYKLRNDLMDIVDRRHRRQGDGRLAPLASPVFLSHSNITNNNNAAMRSSSPAFSPTRSVDDATAEGIGAVFCRYAPLFKLYGGFAKDYEEVAQLLDGYKRDTRLGFAQFLEACRERSRSDESFESLLIKPIQRIPRYKLLLERICEFTPAGHRDELSLREAVARVTDAASLINETIRDHANLESVLETQTEFAGQLSLVTADRRLLRSGTLTKMSTKRHEEVLLHLFNDILVYSGVLITGGYRVRRVVQLTSKAVGVRTQIPASHHALFQHRNLRYDCGFVVTSLEKTFVLFAATPEERHVWIESITSAIDAAQKKQQLDRTSSSLDTLADAAAPLWVPDAVVESCTVCDASFKVYFRRHHCRRCGAVVCGNCSARRSILFVGESSREERVCTPCFKVLRLVKIASFKWLSLVVQFKGILRRKRWGKWSEHYFELKAGILKQYTLASASGLHAKCCTDTLNLTGAIVIHRADQRSMRNRFCFQISTSDTGADLDLMPARAGSPIVQGRGSSSKKLSPLKAAASRFGFDPASSRHRESTGTILSSEGSGSNLARAQHEDLAGWVLCATSQSEEMDWTNAIQRSADRALLRSRRSRVTECAFPVPFERGTSVPSSLGGGAGASVSLSVVSETDGIFANEHAKLEQRRHQIIKGIVRAEESYVTCLGECIRLFVQPLLLRQLEAQKLLRRKQSKRKSSFLHSLGGSGSHALNAAAAMAQRKCSSGNVMNLPPGMRLVASSSGSSRSMPLLTDTSAPSPSSSKMLVLDADMAIFFSSIDQICTLNQQLLDHLSRHLDEVNRDESGEDREYRPGAIFSAYAPLFQLYTAYASRHQAALAAIASPPFAAFLKEIQGDAGAHRLCTYLNMPMERIPRYRVFLQELLQSTPPDHMDYAPLQSALKSVEQVTTKLKEIIARRESARKVDEVGKTVGMDLRGKRFVCDGMLKKVCRKKVQQYYFVLLEDALVYGRPATGLHKKKFRLIELTECKVSDDSASIPRAVNHVTGCAKSHNAFYFFSPLKSFILVASSEEDKLRWMHSMQESIDRTLRSGPRHSSRRASIRSELLLDEEEAPSEYELEHALVIKNGWLNVVNSKRDHKATSRRLWITLNMQTLSMSLLFKGAQLEDSISIGLCEAVPMKEPTFFRVYVCSESISTHTVDRTAYTFETQTAAEREEWLRALHHCISGSLGASELVEMKRRSLSSSAIHAPILLFNKVSSVCMICLQSFAVYRPRHHCRLCGSLVCGHCSKRKWTLTYGTYKKASRICDGCAEAATGSASSLVSDV